MRASRWLLALVLAPAAGHASQEAPAVTTRASKTDVTVGERFVVELSVTGPEGTAWTVPAEPGDDRVELRPATPAEVPVPPGVHRYQATVFATGEVAVPAIEVRYRLPDGTQGAVASEPIALRVLSVLPRDEQEQKLVDIRAPRGVSIGVPFWGATATLLLVLAAMAYWGVRRWRRTNEPQIAAPPPVPPDVEALQRLERLAASGLLARGELRPFYIELTQIAKGYLERRLAAPVLEMTSSEMVAFLRQHPAAGMLASPARELAGAADEVKFAGGSAVTQQAEHHLDVVRDWVRQLEARLCPSDTGEGP